MALESQVALTNIQTKNRASVNKLATTEEEIKKLRAKVKAKKAQKSRTLPSWILPLETYVTNFHFTNSIKASPLIEKVSDIPKWLGGWRSIFWN